MQRSWIILVHAACKVFCREWVAWSLQRQPKNVLVHNVPVWAETKKRMERTWLVVLCRLVSPSGWDSTWHWCVCACTCVCESVSKCVWLCVWWRKERSECCWGDGESAQCSVEDWRQGTQCVLRQSLCISLPPSLTLSLSLSLCEYNPFHSLRGRAANEPALSLPLSLHFPLVLYLSFAHEPRAELPSTMPPPCSR